MELAREQKVLEVFADPVWRALDPKQPFIVARYLTPALNPFADCGIRIAALTLTIRHMKLLPGRQMLLEDLLAGRYDGVDTLVVPSSGNTADAIIRHAKGIGIKKMKIVLASDVPAAKVTALRAYGDFVDVLQVANVTATAIEEAKKPGHYLLDQYSHEGNPRSHELYTGPEIVRALGGEPPELLSLAMGSGGTAMGNGKYFMENYPDTSIIGVRPKLGQQVPGSRDKNRMDAVVTLPYINFVHSVQEVSRKDAFIRTRQLCFEVEPPPGPTSGLAFAGLLQYLSTMVSTMDSSIRTTMYGKDKRSEGFTAAFLCPDQVAPYSDLMLAELDTNQGLV